jgi:thiamine kinase-like enzyme
MRGLTAEEAALAVEQAVALHAPRWGDDSLLALLGRTREEGAELLQAFYAATVEGTLARLGHRVGAAVIELSRDLAPFIARWAMGTGTPQTLTHMDFRPDNFLFGVAEDAPPLVVVDWQTIGYALGTCDVAYMIGGGFEPDQRRPIERDLVSEYCRLLNAAGVDYDQDVCWRDYRWASVWGVVMSVVATMLAEQTERGDEMLTTMLRRHAHHALDLDALELLG